MSSHSTAAFQSIMTGLQEALDYERGTLKQPVKTRRITIAPLPRYQGQHIKHLREKLHLTQRTFAEVFGVSKKTVEAWEAGHNIPQGPAQRILRLLDTEHDFLTTHRILTIQEDVPA